jgi:hypothetical protein
MEELHCASRASVRKRNVLCGSEQQRKEEEAEANSKDKRGEGEKRNGGVNYREIAR